MKPWYRNSQRRLLWHRPEFSPVQSCCWITKASMDMAVGIALLSCLQSAIQICPYLLPVIDAMFDLRLNLPWGRTEISRQSCCRTTKDVPIAVRYSFTSWGVIYCTKTSGQWRPFSIQHNFDVGNYSHYSPTVLLDLDNLDLASRILLKSCIKKTS